MRVQFHLKLCSSFPEQSFPMRSITMFRVPRTDCSIHPPSMAPQLTDSTQISMVVCHQPNIEMPFLNCLCTAACSSKYIILTSVRERCGWHSTDIASVLSLAQTGRATTDPNPGLVRLINLDRRQVKQTPRENRGTCDYSSKRLFCHQHNKQRPPLD